MPPSVAFALDPIPVSRPWGGARIAPRFGWPDPTRPAGEKRGEWWLASCRPEAASRMAGGGPTLAQWLETTGKPLGAPPADRFPLLLKFLDSDAVLSLQVHPDDATAARQGLASGKTEAWHILAAEPGARVFVGTARGVTCRQLLDRVEAGAGDAEITSLLHAIDVAPGDTLLVPAGSVHATGPGLALFEVQQNSDTTWRIHDWGRSRPVHLARARESARDLPRCEVRPENPNARGLATLVDTPAFVLRRARLDAGEPLPLRPANGWALLTVLAGTGRLSAGPSQHALVPGATLFALGPATLAGAGLDVLVVESG